VYIGKIETLLFEGLYIYIERERERERERDFCLFIEEEEEGIPSKLSSYTFIFCGYSIFHMQRKCVG
jgi:hypothetical protein